MQHLSQSRVKVRIKSGKTENNYAYWHCVLAKWGQCSQAVLGTECISIIYPFNFDIYQDTCCNNMLCASIYLSSIPNCLQSALQIDNMNMLTNDGSAKQITLRSKNLLTHCKSIICHERTI